MFAVAAVGFVFAGAAAGAFKLVVALALMLILAEVHVVMIVLGFFHMLYLGTTMVGNNDCGFGLGGKHAREGDCYDGEFSEMLFHIA